MKKFRGIFPVAVTPFDKDGNFNIEGAKQNLDRLIEAGVHGICVLGATGEYQSITIEEHKKYVKEIVPYIKDRVKVIVGVSKEMPDEAIELTRNAEAAGAHAVMILPTYYCHPSQDEIYEYYRYIVENTENISIMLYNNPGSAGVEIGSEIYPKLMELDRVEIVKESSGNIRKLTEVLMAAPEKVSVFCGWDNMAYESFVTGACGWISMLANLAPKQCVEMFEAVNVEKDYEKAYEIYKKILPALNILEGFEKPVQVIKYILEKKGEVGGYVRRPRIELTSEEKKYIDEIFPLEYMY